MVEYRQFGTSLGQTKALFLSEIEVNMESHSGLSRFWAALKAFQNRVAIALSVALLLMLETRSTL
jgi:hypothetical protein